jgi:hypothetical protein
MSSLGYSTYQTNENNTIKKRIPTIGKPTEPHRPPLPTAPLLLDEPTIPIIQDQDAKEERVNRMNKLILQNSITSDEHMGDFKPLSPPELSKVPIGGGGGGETSFPKYSPIVPAAAAIEDQLPFPTGDNNYSNYRYVYNTPPTIAPYIRRGGGETSAAQRQGGGDRQEMDKIWEKLNYMTLLLEEQRIERTNFITEEFVLYMFLGIFMIYIVDGFSRTSGKYVR